jgi:hypothetical protein
MTHYRGDSKTLQALKNAIDGYLAKMRKELATLKEYSRNAKGRVKDGGVSGAISFFESQCKVIEQDIADLDAVSKEIGVMVLRYRAAEQINHSMKNLGNGRTR